MWIQLFISVFPQLCTHTHKDKDKDKQDQLSSNEMPVPNCGSNRTIAVPMPRCLNRSSLSNNSWPFRHPNPDGIYPTARRNACHVESSSRELSSYFFHCFISFGSNVWNIRVEHQRKQIGEDIGVSEEKRSEMFTLSKGRLTCGEWWRQ